MTMREPVEIERGRKDNRAGMPRPLAKTQGALRPVPWTNAAEWGVLHTDRAELSARCSRCLVCGMPVAEGRILTSSIGCPVTVGQADLHLYAADGGPLHDRCAKMTAAHCQYMRDALRQGTMWAVKYCRHFT